MGTNKQEEREMSPSLNFDMLEEHAPAVETRDSEFLSWLIDLMQLYSLSSHPNTLILRDVTGREAFICIDRGRVVHVACPSNEGLEAFYCIARWPRGEFVRRVKRNICEKETIDESLSELLMNVYWEVEAAGAEETSCSACRRGAHGGRAREDVGELASPFHHREDTRPDTSPLPSIDVGHSLDEVTIVQPVEAHNTPRDLAGQGHVLSELLRFERLRSELSAIEGITSFEILDVREEADAAARGVADVFVSALGRLDMLEDAPELYLTLSGVHHVLLGLPVEHRGVYIHTAFEGDGTTLAMARWRTLKALSSLEDESA